MKTNMLAPYPAERTADLPLSPTHEAGRLEALDRFDILDTPAEAAFDRLARFAQKLFSVPIAIVSFIDGHRQWYKSCVGLSSDGVPREQSFCRYVVAQGDPMVIEDATRDPRFADNPFVTGAPGVRFYAGAPLTSDDGFPIGSVCLIDTRPRSFSAAERELLTDLAHVVMDELRLRLAAGRDGLTGVLSRRAFRQELERSVALALRHRQDLSVLLFDIDRFKLINDTHGHGTGDAVLKRVVESCLPALRKTDVVGRIGGEEFAIITPNTGNVGALDVAEKLRQAVARPTHVIRDAIVKATISVGVASIDAAARDADTLLENADKALYQAKNSGRNRCVVWLPPEKPHANRRRVLKAGQILLHGGASTIDCTVRSLSDEGAGIDVSSTAGIPKRFRLVLKADGIDVPCSVTQQTPTHLEAAFDPAS